MEELWRLYREDRLVGAQQALFDCPRPVEELYDTEADPFEIVNLAADARHQVVLGRLRKTLDTWTATVGDLGTIPEEEMVRRWWPDGQQPTTAPVSFVPLADESPGRETVAQGGWFDSPCRLQLHCATQGASIAYTFDEGREARWRLYAEPLRMRPGRSKVRAHAVRIGFAESEETSASFTITAG
jgi:hypothetical protein